VTARRKLIKGDIAEATMPKVCSTLKDEGVWKILAYIRSIYAGDGSKLVGGCDFLCRPLPTPNCARK
jgi:hypothetical protein